MNPLRRLLRWARRTFVYDEMADVRDFNTKFELLQFDTPGHLKRQALQDRVSFLREELREFEEACRTQSLEDQADALIDIVYVAKGTAIMLGLPWEELWQDVQRANMEKELGPLEPHGATGGYKRGVVKPIRWQPPVTRAILMQNGYHAGAYGTIGPDGDFKVYEKACRGY